MVLLTNIELLSVTSKSQLLMQYFYVIFMSLQAIEAFVASRENTQVHISTSFFIAEHLRVSVRAYMLQYVRVVCVRFRMQRNAFVFFSSPIFSGAVEETEVSYRSHKYSAYDSIDIHTTQWFRGLFECIVFVIELIKYHRDFLLWNLCMT